jgi:hypothetical protein
MSTKKRISLQLPQRTSLQREEPSSSDESVSMSLSSASGSWVSSVTSERSDGGNDNPSFFPPRGTPCSAMALLHRAREGAGTLLLVVVAHGQTSL